MRKDLQNLEALAAMVFDAELAKLNDVSKLLAVRNGELTALAAARAARAEVLRAGSAGEDLAFVTGQDARWSAWLARTGARLSREVAEVAAQREDQRLRTKKAFGKRDALRQMREHEEKERRQKRMKAPG
jgi:hypothetical protein